MSGEGFIAGGGQGFEAGFYGGDRGVGNHRGKGTGFISHHEIERGLICDGVRAVVVGEFGVGDRFGPRCGVIAAEDTKVSLDFLIDSFSFAVGLRVIGSRKGEIIVQELPELSREGGCELGSSVRDDFIKKSEAKEDFVEKEGCDSFGGDGFLGRAKNYPLSKPMVYHDHKGIEARRNGEVGDKVAGNLLKRARGDGLNG